MKDTYIEADHCIQEALQGSIVHLNDNFSVHDKNR